MSRDRRWGLGFLAHVGLSCVAWGNSSPITVSLSFVRRCSRTSCEATAVATLTYVYAESTAVLGPLALTHEPGAYDLCSKHAESLSVPKNWEVIRLPQSDPVAEHRERTADDELMALADAVRQIGLRHDEVSLPEAPSAPVDPVEPRLRIVRE